MKKILTIVLLFALAGLTQADTITIPNDGVTIRASSTNQAGSTIVFVGNTTTSGDIMRGVIAFPLNAPELTRAGVNSVTITFNGTGVENCTGIRDVTLHECSSFVDTQVTWYNRNASTLWTTPGGDYGAVLDTKTIDTVTWGAGKSITFSGEALAAAVQNNLGGTFYVLAKMTDEVGYDAVRSLARFDDTFSITIDYTDISANTPFPADGDYHSDISATFGWKPGIDPANPSVPNPAILKHRLTYRTGDPNFLAAGTTTVEIDADVDLDGQVDPDAVYGPVTFSLDQVVYWKVDEIIADANAVPGHVWSFATLQSTPEINPALPADTLVDLGEYTEITVDATNPFTGDATGLSYQWMYSPDGVSAYSAVGTDSPILAVASAQAADTGYYYCAVTIDSNGKSASSRVAQLIVKQTLAHWTMDQADYVNGFHLDIAGTHNAEPNSAPTFAAGAGPDMPEAGAVVMNPNSFAAVGTWNPVETTGQMTLSTWIKWDGTLAAEIASSGKDILSKSDGWGEDIMMWSLKLRGMDSTNTKAGIWFYNKLDAGIRFSGLVPVDTWTHLCVTYAPGQSQMYINGELLATNNNAALSTGTTSTMKIGGGSTGSVFPGAMDEVMFHNYAMSAEDAATLYYQTSKEGICLYPPAIDFNGDCKTDLIDLAEFAKTWLACGLVPVEVCNQ